MDACGLRAGMTVSQPAKSQHPSVLRGARARRLSKYRDYWPKRVEVLGSLLEDIDNG